MTLLVIGLKGLHLISKIHHGMIGHHEGEKVTYPFLKQNSCKPYLFKIRILSIQLLVISWRPVSYLSFGPFTPRLRYRRATPNSAHLLNTTNFTKELSWYSISFTWILSKEEELYTQLPSSMSFHYLTYIFKEIVWASHVKMLKNIMSFSTKS